MGTCLTVELSSYDPPEPPLRCSISVASSGPVFRFKNWDLAIADEYLDPSTNLVPFATYGRRAVGRTCHVLESPQRRRFASPSILRWNRRWVLESSLVVIFLGPSTNLDFVAIAGDQQHCPPPATSQISLLLRDAI